MTFITVAHPGNPREFYKQCVLSKGSVQTVTWIPEKFAKKNKVLKIREHGEWDDGWKVESVGARQSEVAVFMLRDSYRGHRRTTDI